MADEAPQANWEALAKQQQAQLSRCERAIRMAYQKHHVGDENIGWNELSDVLSEVLHEFNLQRQFEGTEGS